MEELDFDLETAIEQENIRVRCGKAALLLMCYEGPNPIGYYNAP
jgi:hypothetical protein